MSLKLKLLKILAFAMEQFDKDHTHLFVLITEEIEIEALRHEQQLLTTLQPR